jgi:hypothetical protein
VSLTESQAQALIIATVGDVDPATGQPPAVPNNGILYANMAVIWDSYAAMDTVYPGLQRLSAERHAYLMVLGVLRRQYDLKAGSASLSRSQQVKAIVDALGLVENQIAVMLRQANAGTAAVGEITRVAPFTPDDALAVPTQLDANGPALRGSPYGLSWPNGRS